MSNTDPVAVHLKLVETRASLLLEYSQLGVQLAELKSIIFDYHHTGFKSYCAQMIAMFGTAERSLDENEVLSVIQDAWNYFPHKSLKGRSPAEIFVGMASARGAGLS